MAKKVDFSADALNSFKKNLIEAENVKKQQAQSVPQAPGKPAPDRSAPDKPKPEKKSPAVASAPTETPARLFIPRPVEREAKGEVITIRLKKSMKTAFKDKCERQGVSQNYILEQLIQIYIDLAE